MSKPKMPRPRDIAVIPSIQRDLRNLARSAARLQRPLVEMHNSIAYLHLIEEEHICARILDLLATIRWRLSLRDGPQFMKAMVEVAQLRQEDDQLPLPLRLQGGKKDRDSE